MVFEYGNYRWAQLEKAVVVYDYLSSEKKESSASLGAFVGRLSI